MSSKPDDRPRRWGKAGVRLTPQEIAHRSAAATVRRAKRDIKTAENLRIAYEKWKAGMVVPHAITSALDERKLYGPEVDEACGVREPAVDLWEAAKLYPTWEQLLALAELTCREPIYFVTARETLSIYDTSMRFHVKPGELFRYRPPVMRYPDVVWQQCPGTGFPKSKT